MLYLRNYLAQDAGGLTGRLDRRFEFRWPWLPGETWETTVSVHLERAGYGTLLTLTDGPFDLCVPGVLDAYAEALAWLRGVVDFSSDLRPRPY